MTASTPNPRRWCEIDGPHPSHPSEWGGDICPGAVPEDLDIVPIEPHPWSAPPAPSSGSPAPTCGDCDGTGWYDGDNRCPNGCPIPASSGSPAPILDAPITWDASADTGPIAWCVAHGSKAALCAAAGRACRAASTFSAPAPLSPVPEDGPRPVDVTALPEWQALVEAVSKAGGRMGARWMMPVGDRAIALVGAARRLAAAADRGGEQQ